MWMTTRPPSSPANRRVWRRPAGGARARGSDARVRRSITHRCGANLPCDNRASGSAPDKASSVNPRDPANISYRLGVLAYNLGNLWRRLVLPERIGSWSLTSLQQRLVKTGGRLVRHARYYWLLLAESHLTKGLFGAMLRRIWALPMPTG